MRERKLALRRHWTDEDIELLISMWRGSSTNTEIREKFDINHNQLAGRAGRLGLHGYRHADVPGANQKKKRAPKKKGVATVEAVPEVVPTPVVVLPSPPPVPVVIKETEPCKWPVGDPTSAEFKFC